MDLQSEKYGLSFDIKKYTTSGWALGDENVISIRALKVYLGQMTYGFNQNCSKEHKHFSLVLVGEGVKDKIVPKWIFHVMICNSRTRYARSIKIVWSRQNVVMCAFYAPTFLCILIFIFFFFLFCFVFLFVCFCFFCCFCFLFFGFFYHRNITTRKKWWGAFFLWVSFISTTNQIRQFQFS